MMSVDPRELRTCLGHFATGVTVVTCHTADGTAHGATVNAFTAVSLDPPLVLVSVNRASKVSGLLAGAPFTVNVLQHHQSDLALHFAGRPSLEDVPWSGDAVGASPRLSDCLAWVSCTPWRRYDGGDHVLYLGEVQAFEVTRGRPLLFHSGRFHRLGLDADPLPWDGSGDAPGAVSWVVTTAATATTH